MAYSDPQSVTIGGTATPLPRTGMTIDAGEFSSADRLTSMAIRHSKGKRVRHNVLLKVDSTVPDPLVPAQNRPVSYQASLTLDLPQTGVTAAQILAVGKALVAWATDANLTALAGGQS